MTENQDIAVTKKLKTSHWNYLGDCGNWKVYETCECVLFAVSKVSYDVFFDEEEEFIVY
ncbi:hypothetical protein [Sulfurimonas sp.]|uniref:hypothetical protein n=1 Tax=Sulfurimonas sp. TaxID=2022749 RepID=UPI0025DDA13E|nr:hypothetical protein [Sulfurimonas sp.]